MYQLSRVYLERWTRPMNKWVIKNAGMSPYIVIAGKAVQLKQVKGVDGRPVMVAA